MLKKMMIFMAILFAIAVLFTGCRRGSSLAPGATDREEEIKWTNPDFNMDEVVDIGNEWTLDLSNIAPESWSDNDEYSQNPTADVAAVVPNPNGGYDFTFTKFNQRAIFVLDSSQRAKVANAESVTVTIDGNASSNNKDFRYHIGLSESGLNWNTTASFDPAPFSDILERTISCVIGFDRISQEFYEIVDNAEPPLTEEEEIELEEELIFYKRAELGANFMIQTRGGLAADPFGDPVTITIRSITFRVN